ncbi:MAG: hypothetical protein DIZ78_02375 [endosymbiont of Escarpia spicata]|uniref:Uncharacterized protein n=1 Tax=endosymbiont of Escarpia spicata TaxID=2200908 RepID=A0A370DQS5_9GAMM|nr:MAG: hypothetical protein DIZ78_02375 [endosymbiont of Escarpia spicata]
MKVMRKAGLILCGITFVYASAFAGEFIGVDPLFKNGNLITPHFEMLDDDADDYPDRFKISFKVWTAGTTTYIRRTRVRTFLFPQTPCTSPAWEDHDFDLKFTGTTAVSRVHTAVSLYSECEETGSGDYKESIRTVLYSGNVDDGGSWMRTWAGPNLLGMNHVDWDSDGTNEMMVVMAVDKSGLTTSFSSRVVFVDPSNGTVESDKTYTNLYIENY